MHLINALKRFQIVRNTEIHIFATTCADGELRFYDKYPNAPIPRDHTIVISAFYSDDWAEYVVPPDRREISRANLLTALEKGKKVIMDPFPQGKTSTEYTVHLLLRLTPFLINPNPEESISSNLISFNTVSDNDKFFIEEQHS